MTLEDFIRLLLRHWKLLVLVPLTLAISIFFFTRKQEKVYASDTTIYTGIASGYSIKGNNEADFYATSNAFDNILTLINSRDTKEEVAFRLLATHLMLPDYDPDLLNWNSFIHLREVFPDSIRKELVASTYEQTLANIKKYNQASSNNFIYEVLNSDEPYYSINALAKLNASRISSSDLIKLEYETIDPAICKHTLSLLTLVFIERYKSLREGLTEPVISYFKEETRKAYQNLALAERKYLEFNKKNNIINFEEQTRNISSHKDNLYRDYTEIEMQYAGAQSALKAIERKLSTQAASTLSSQELINLRSKLANLNAQITEIQLNGNQNAAGNSQTMVRLRSEAAQTANAIRGNVNDYFTQTHSTQGIANKELLDEWVKNAILVDESRSKLRVIGKRKNSFDQEYQQLAPLGATLKGIEREINLAEQEYLSLLNSLNQSQLTEQSNEITTQLKVVDPPYLPIKAKNSKRIILILAGLAGSFIFLVGCLVAREFLDKSLRNSSKAGMKTGLPVAGIFPALFPKSKNHVFEQKIIDQFIRQILLKSNTKKELTAFKIGFISSLNNEGKSTIIQVISQKLNNIGIKTLVVFPSDNSQVSLQSGPTLQYNAVEVMAKDLLLEDITDNLDDYKIVLIEFPALLESAYPIAMLKQLDLILLTIRANRAWRKADMSILANILEVTQAPAEVLLNGVLPQYGEESAGEAPRHRGKIRQWAKQITRRELGSNATFPS